MYDAASFIDSDMIVTLFVIYISLQNTLFYTKNTKSVYLYPIAQTDKPVAFLNDSAFKEMEQKLINKCY